MSRLPKDLTYDQYKQIYMEFYPMCARSLEEYHKDLKESTKNNPTVEEIRYLYDNFISYNEKEIEKMYNKYLEKTHVDNIEEVNKDVNTTLIIDICICKKGLLVFPIVHTHKLRVEKNTLTDKYIFIDETPVKPLSKTNNRLQLEFYDSNYEQYEYETEKDALKDLDNQIEYYETSGNKDIEDYSLSVFEFIGTEVRANPDLREFEQQLHITTTYKCLNSVISEIDLLSYFVSTNKERSELVRSLKKLDKKNKVSMIKYSLYIRKEMKKYLAETLLVRAKALITLLCSIKDGNNNRGITLDYVKSKIQLRITKKYSIRETEYFYYFIYCLYYLNSIFSIY